MIARFGLGLAVAALCAMPLLAKDAPPKTDPKAEALHVVQPGETLAGIASCCPGLTLAARFSPLAAAISSHGTP